MWVYRKMVKSTFSNRKYMLIHSWWIFPAIQTMLVDPRGWARTSGLCDPGSPTTRTGMNGSKPGRSLKLKPPTIETDLSSYHLVKLARDQKHNHLAPQMVVKSSREMSPRLFQGNLGEGSKYYNLARNIMLKGDVSWCQRSSMLSSVFFGLSPCPLTDYYIFSRGSL